MVARAIPGLGMGLNPYIDPNAAMTATDTSQALMPTGSAVGNGISSWLGALGMALLSSPRQSPFQTLPQIMPAMMQQQMQQAALAQQAGIWNAGIKAFGQAPGLDSLFPAGGAPTAPTMPNIGSGQTPQYPDTGMPNMSAGGALGKISDPRNKIPVIQQAALRYGIDPLTAVKVAASEGLGNPVGDNGMSRGAFQLYLGGGEGNNFVRDTGLDPTDPKNEDATINYALQRASQIGWGPWRGAKRIGVRQWDGIGQAPSVTPAVQYAQAAPQTMTDASSGSRPGVQTLPNPFMPDAQPDTTPTAAGPSAQYTPEEIARYRAMGIPLSPMSAQQALQNQNGQAPSATAPQSLPDGTPQRPSTLAQAQTGPGPGPTPLQQQQALAAVQRPPPPSPDTVNGGLAAQRAAAMRYYEYYGNLALRLAPFGEAGKTFADLAMKRADIAKELLTEDQKKRLELQYSGALAYQKGAGEAAAAYQQPANNIPFQTAMRGATTTAETLAKVNSQIAATGTDPNSPQGQAMALNMMPNTQPEAIRIAQAAGLQGPAYNQALAGAIPGNAPTSEQKAAQVYLSGTPAEQAALQRAQTSGRPLNIGTIPPDYQAVPTPEGGLRMEAVPGSPAELQQASLRAQAKMSGAIVNRAVDHALSLSNAWSTGGVGALLQAAPYTDAYNLRNTLDTLKAQTSFTNLAQMRAASPSGGALGQISNFEDQLLQRAWANIEQSQNKDQFENNLKALKQTFDYAVNGVPDLLDKLRKGEITRDQYNANIDHMLSQYGSGDTTKASPAQRQSAAPFQPMDGQTLTNARNAIAQGANRALVIQKLQQNGYDPSGL